MKISVELTLTPLSDHYESIIKDFIKSLRQSEFKIIETPLSTQIYGDFNEVMRFLNKKIYNTFLNSENIIMNMKIIKSDRSNYVPNF
ncbi:thiamine-binding protein [Flavobacteriaceae bacterium]|nr:thiamine-binding protein [Flavobacteriaceae bacterium]